MYYVKLEVNFFDVIVEIKIPSGLERMKILNMDLFFIFSTLIPVSKSTQRNWRRRGGLASHFPPLPHLPVSTAAGLSSQSSLAKKLTLKPEHLS